MFACLSLIILSLKIGIGRSENSTYVKCCDDGIVIDESYDCEKLLNGNETLSDFFYNTTNKDGIIYARCYKHGDAAEPSRNTRNVNNHTCIDVFANGTRVRYVCDSQSFTVNSTFQHCDSTLTQLKFWGATIVIFATIVYNVPFIIVVIIYTIFSELRTRAYDKGVMCYNMCYIVINFLLIILGYHILCHTSLSVTAYRLFGLGLMFNTQGAVIWALILCFDMTLVITRFRWAPKGGADRGREEKRKFFIYSTVAWSFSTSLTLVAAIAEFSPIFSEDSPFRPNFHNFGQANVAVIVYVATGPVVVCLATTSLFIYTTVKTIAVQRSIAVVNENRKTNVKKKYLLFLKLYIVMDTPWVTSALGAIYDDLWVLKFIKMVQPIVMLVLIIPRKRVLRAMDRKRDNVKVERAVERPKENNGKNTNVNKESRIQKPHIMP